MIYVSLNPKVEEAKKDADSLLAMLQAAEEGLHPVISREYARAFLIRLMYYGQPRA